MNVGTQTDNHKYFFKFNPLMQSVKIKNSRYDSSTGIFTVPSGGDGFYYLSTYLRIDDGEYGLFDLTVNGIEICKAAGDNSFSGMNDYDQGTRSAVVLLAEDRLKVPHCYCITKLWNVLERSKGKLQSDTLATIATTVKDKQVIRTGTS